MEQFASNKRLERSIEKAYVLQLEEQNEVLSQRITELENTIDQEYVRKLEENNSLLSVRIIDLEKIIKTYIEDSEYILRQPNERIAELEKLKYSLSEHIEYLEDIILDLEKQLNAK